MVKMSETIICQRFVQNTWKKDLCSNCFKSKEDHAVPEKKITYRWTSHVDNFPQHGILRRSEKCNGDKRKHQSVSFQPNETEIIGYGGEECSSDDEFYPSYNDEPVLEADNEEEDKEFRKLTQTNTDFNSVPANLRNDKPPNKTISPPKTYSCLKLGTPQTDADGRRQTLQVSVEPFKNSVTVNANGGGVTLSNDSKVHLNKILLEASTLSNGKGEEKTEPIETAKTNGKCDLKNDKVVLSKESVVCDINANSINDKCTVVNNNVTNVNVNETINEQNIYTKTNAAKEHNGDCSEKFIRINVPKPEQQIESKILDEISSKDVAENMKNAKCKLEPLFKLNAFENTSPTKRLSIYQSTVSEDKIDSSEDKKRLSFKDSNPIAGLPLITSKDIEIEIDRPGSREMVGEPDGKADSDDSGDPPVSVEYLEENKIDADSLYANPQRSFLHGLLKEKPTPAVKPVSLQNGLKKELVLPKETREPVVSSSVPSTPKMHVANSCNGTGSTKRQAPKPPSPKTAPQTPILGTQKSLTMTPIGSVIDFSDKKSEFPMTNEVSTIGVKRKLNLDSNLLNRNSLNLNLILGQGSYKSNSLSNGSTSPVASVNGDYHPIENSLENGTARSPTKCARSLSCDSIASSPSITLSEKSRKYSGATIKMKSTIRKLLRFNNKDDEKSENEVQIASIPRRRIEIIHPLDLNKSSIEILPPASAEEAQKTDTESEPRSTPTTPSTPSCPPIPGRPTKPPPPPRTQSLDQKITSEISRPVRPPPPKSIAFKTPPPPRFECLSKTSNNVYENLGESRQSVAPAKPQRASSIRDRARQQTTTVRDENLIISVSERESVPECDRTVQSDSSETPTSITSSSIPYCGSETESEMYHSVSSSTTDSTHSELSDAVSEPEPKKGKSIIHSCLEDNYGAVVVANHETLSHLLEQLNQTTLVPNALKVLQTTLHIRFEHLVVVESSKIAVSDWYFYNSKWNGHDVVVSLSTKPLGPLKSLPPSITLFPLVKFTDLIPSRYIRNDTSVDDVNAYVTVWNEQKIESLSSYCKKPENLSVAESGLLLSQLINAFNHLLACDIEDISLNEIFVCKRDSDLESKLMLLPITVDYITNTIVDKNSTKKMSLCKCVPEVMNMLLPKQQINQVIKRVLEDEKPICLSQAKSVVEYWLWGPCDVTLINDRQPALQRWLDLERAKFLHKIVCKKYNEFSLSEKSHLMFLVRTNAKLLTEASYLLEKQST